MFFYVLFLIIVFIEIILTSTISIKIKNFKLSTEKYNGRLINGNYKITISLCALRKIRFLNLEITRKKLKEINVKDKIKRIVKKIDFQKIKKSKNIDIKSLKLAKKYIPKIKYIDLIANIGTEDAVITSYIVVTISSLLGMLLKEQLAESYKSKFIINPIYINKILLNLEFNCILETKLIHIIYIIYILNKKRRDDKNVRTSNRRSYGYSYE